MSENVHSGPRPSPDGVRDNVRIVLRPIGAPTPIGFFGLAAATFVLSGLQLGWVDQTQTGTVALVLIAFTFPAQLLAAIFSVLARDGVAATAMTVLALNWLVVGLALREAAPGSTSTAAGLFLLVTGTAMALTAATASRVRLVPALVFLLAAARLTITGIFELTAGGAWQDTAGVIGLVLAAAAVYAAWAAQLEDATGRTLLPFGRRGDAKAALEDPLPQQVTGIAAEPGVRTQL